MSRCALLRRAGWLMVAALVLSGLACGPGTTGITKSATGGTPSTKPDKDKQAKPKPDLG